MIGRTVLAALIAGLLAGLLAAAVHHVRLNPMIAQAEVFENAAHTVTDGPATVDPAAVAPASGIDHSAHQHGTAADAPAVADEHAEHEHGWKPAEGLERIMFTSVTWMLSGIGFALLLTGVSLVSGISITPQNAIMWGLCGFLAIALAPAAGLAPEPPGMPAADLTARQIWWVGTALATGIGIYLIASRRSPMALMAAPIVIALPHIIGAPQPLTHDSAVPASLAAAYVGNDLAVNAVFWVLLGLALGYILPHITKEFETS